MTSPRKWFGRPMWALKAVLFGGLVGLVGYRTAPPNLFDVSKNLDIFGRVLREISLNYVEEVEINNFTRVGVEAMLKSLDPYTNYYSAAEIEDYRFLSTGQYGGIGTTTQFRDGRLIITEIQEGSPAQANNLWVGDEILRIDRQILAEANLSAEVASSLLRGQPGSWVEVEVRRPGDPSSRTIRLKREDIKLENVPHFGLLEGGVAYVALSGFTRDASAEVRRSLGEIRKLNPELKGIVLDLRGNLGGLLYEAIAVSNLFVDQGEVIVETKGRMEGSLEVYTAPNPPYDTQTPVAVLIDGQSASASEIVAGVLQDLDRGVVVGQRSYGKGLVQTTRPLSYNTQIKLTTSKYYTPSGRCIQEIDYSQGGAQSVVKQADSLGQVYRTRAGRAVFAGQGITPDIVVGGTETHKLLKDLQESFLIFDFATEFRFRNPSLGDPARFRVSEEVFQQFVAYLRSRNFIYSSRALLQLERLKESFRSEAEAAPLPVEISQLESVLRAQADQAVWELRPAIERLLQQAIVERYAFRAGVIENSFSTDPVVQQALQVLLNPGQYKAQLSPNR